MKRLPFLIAIALAAVGCDRQQADPVEQRATIADGRPDVAVSEADATPRPPAEPTAAGDMIDRLDGDIEFYAKKGRDTNSWIHLERAASMRMHRARLTGDIGDYLAAKRLIDEAFAMAKKGAGPFMTRARYNYAIHRIADVERDVAQVEAQLLLQDSDKEAIAAMRGDIAFHEARLPDARNHYREALEHEETAATIARLALLDLKTGNFDAARKGYAKVAELSQREPYSRSWALLHRGIVELETGNVAEALKWYEKADEAFSGWYLIEEHIAEAKLLLGDPEAAIELYESIIARTPSGEFMAAMAESWAAKQNAELEKQWLDRAARAFERDIERLPSAASGHALEFYLAHDAKRALELAESNFELRPNHESRTLLAQAFIANGSPERARETLQPVVDSSWATPDYFATIAIAFDGADDQVAGAANKKAAALDPDAVTELRETLGL